MFTHGIFENLFPESVTKTAEDTVVIVIEVGNHRHLMNQYILEDGMRAYARSLPRLAHWSAELSGTKLTITLSGNINWTQAEGRYQDGTR